MRERDADEGGRERRVRAALPSAAATAVVLVFSFCSDEFRFGYYGSRWVQVNGQNFDRTRVSCGDFSSTWFQFESRFSLIPVAWFEIRVRYGSYLGSSLQPVSVQVRVMYQLGSVRCSGQTVNCRVKSGQSWSTKLSVQSGYGFGSSG
ncbi:hypothetical protein HanXRQr2_Chr12g0525511 [Helianthus annuus]|uniref:Uncharacterized protein n=1 Tax=Helianthus annuus TaxID=4232 RepID=A0A251T2F1_HELAN|nr:hypothetical protein HanXRQr2_Chr12g0525511 [Helianthus annuus]KAJ0861408.1 hypothetical protein HanPSC8_Chr12g0506301 [Helianthus annuus]